jgi:hypothetical protein
MRSTPWTGGPLDELLGCFAAAAGPGDPNAEYFADRDPGTEETMAFPLGSDGRRLNSIQIVAAAGDRSRSRVLGMLAAGTDWRSA